MTINELITRLEEIQSDTEELTQLPETELNNIYDSIGDTIQILEKCSNEYGDEDIDYSEDEENYDED